MKRIYLHDTCGVNNLHGIPGIISGITGVIVASLATVADYGYDKDDVDKLSPRYTLLSFNFVLIIMIIFFKIVQILPSKRS